MSEQLNVLLIGSGGREHAIAWKLAQSPRVENIFVAPGNGGTAFGLPKVSNVNIAVNDFSKLAAFALENQVNLVVPGPEQPLVEGIQLVFKKIGIACFGPSPRAAVMEGSKTFAKNFMKKYQIPTAAYENFSDYEQAKAYINKISYNVVIKASGLAGGKGVLIPSNKQEALDALKEIMVDRVFGSAGDEVVIEEYLEGQELSVLAFSDGYTIVTLPPAQDHKRIYDGDMGPNTGGMGCYCPTPIATPELLYTIKHTILQPTIVGMRREGFPFVGMLFTGLMITESGPKVLEYNIRFGDPETEAVLPLLDDSCDLAEIMLACTEGRLDSISISFKTGFAATIIVAAGGYPDSYSKGKEISFQNIPSEALIFHGGTSMSNGKLYSSGGRVVAVSGVADTLREAVDKAYETVKLVKFEDMYYRKDIAHRAFTYLEHITSEVKIMTYESAGVSVDSGNQLVEEIKQIIKTTKRPGSDSEIGGFGGLFDLSAAGYQNPILVSATDGVGTKLKIAQAVGKYDTIGIDLVAMSVNDVIVQGAEPLFFLDYYACGHLEIDVVKDVIAGVVEGCRRSGCALIGGETAEMPGLYNKGDFDLAGFAVGAVERHAILPRIGDIKVDDIILGIASSGVHSNGFSLIRKVVTEKNFEYSASCPWDSAMSLGEAFLTPTKIYVKQLLPLIKKGIVKAMAHITGGGLVDNIPRVLPENLGATINATAWKLPPVFSWLAKNGNIPFEELFRTFNCGIGIILVVSSNNISETKNLLQVYNENVYTIGRLVSMQENNTRVVIQGTIENL
ncbi:hypothetical protein G9A89_016255 [Geosiphon pyriformis]|nr:hypothetical protein G9A89_016255 [Geosiphon pyriformis]